MSGSPQWQYYSGCAGSQRVIINHEPMRFDAFFAERHVTRVSVNQCNNYAANKARSLTDLRFLPFPSDNVSIEVSCLFTLVFVLSAIIIG